MLFPIGTEAKIELRSLDADDNITLLGIPRINLDGINKLIQDNPGVVNIKANLPYEMIIVGVY